MKTNTTKLMIATALLTLATGVASAQVLQAEIPFAFRVGSKVMAPGTYTVRVDGQRHNLVILSNFASKNSAIVLPIGPAEVPKEWKAKGDPAMSFECGVGRCELARMWTGYGDPALSFPHHNLGRDERASVTEIKLVRASE
jgi:hypothetical protein